MFQIEQLAKSKVSFQAGTVVDFVPVKTAKINGVQQPENSVLKFKELTRGCRPGPLVPNQIQNLVGALAKFVVLKGLILNLLHPAC